ncbi:MAG: hypothetical protein HZA90_26980, partial [Verrucomicrobia bacterium]|nr:hypothetical protein [Verrucomicrobiota bacterium]
MQTRILTRSQRCHNRIASTLATGLLFITLVQAGSAQCLLHRYWPMHDGDSKFLSSAWSSGSVSFSSTYDGFQMNNGLSGPSAFAGLRYSGDQVLMTEVEANGLELSFTPGLIFLNETILDRGGSTTSTDDISLYVPGYGTVWARVTLTVSASKAGTVTVPAGTYSNCVSVAWTLRVEAEGDSMTFPFNTFVLAPGVGTIKVAVYQATGTSFTQLGWATLSSGQVDGVPVEELASLSGLTVPKFTLQPRTTTATNNGLAVLRATVTGGAIQYRWQKDGWDLTDDGCLTGTDTDTLRINPVGFDDQGLYSLSIENAACTASSTGAVLTVIGDSTRPTVQIQAPAPNSRVSNVTVQVSGRASDNIGVAQVEVWVGNATPLVTSGTTNWTAPIPPPTRAERRLRARLRPGRECVSGRKQRLHLRGQRDAGGANERGGERDAEPERAIAGNRQAVSDDGGGFERLHLHELGEQPRPRHEPAGA